jgi:crossover junction endodeoxyribonuclease RuvC
MKILGIDPGYALVGWAIVEYEKEVGSKPELLDYGVIETVKELELPERLNEIYYDMIEIIAKFKPDAMGMESLVFYKNITTGMAVAEARGVITLAAHQAGLPIRAVAPTQVKNAISGYGKATKNQMQENVKLILGLDEVPKPDDAADAVAVAMTAYDLNAQL